MFTLAAITSRINTQLIKPMTPDGLTGKRIEHRHTEDENGVLEDYTENSYQLRSTVLGGALICNIDQSGNRGIGHVYVGGELLADYQYLAPYTITTIQHRNPTTGQWVANAVRAEPDPLGAESGYSNPYTYSLSYADMIAGEGLYYMRGNAMDIRGGCALDGLPVPCSLVNEAIMSETSSVALEYQLFDGTSLPEQGSIRHFGAGLVLYDHPFLELDNEPGDVPYRVGWRTGVSYAHPANSGRLDLPWEVRELYKNPKSGKALTKCINEVFGKDANRLPYQQLHNAPRVFTYMTGAELAARRGIKGQDRGQTDPKDLLVHPPNGAVYIAKDATTIPTEIPLSATQIIQMTYVHELGVKLAFQLTDGKSDEDWGDPNLKSLKNPSVGVDHDTGNKLEYCFYREMQKP